MSDYESIPQVLDEKAPVVATVELASRSSTDVPQDGAADGANVAVSADGRYVAFSTLATNLQTPPDTNGSSDVYLRDRCIANGAAVEGCTPATTLVSAAPDKGLGTGVSSHPALAANGATTGFVSTAPNLLGAGVDANNLSDVFVRDR